MLGLSFMERYGGHVRVDILIGRLSEKAQAVMAIVTYLLIFVPVYTCMTLGAIKYAYTSTAMGELNSTSWAPPIWPFKILMAVSFFLLLLQGIATVLKYVRKLKTGEPV